MSSQFVFEVTDATIGTLLEQSQQLPVLIDFWADWCQPCQQLAPILDKLAAEWQGRLVVAKLNVDQYQALASQFGVRSLPTLKLVFQGQLVDEKVGALSETMLRQWLEPVLAQLAGDAGADVEAFLAQIRDAVAQGMVSEALAALNDFVGQYPEQLPARLLLVELLLDQGEADQAQALLAEVDDPQAAPLKSRLALLLAAGGVDTPSADLAGLPPEERLAAARQVAVRGEWEQGLDALLGLMQEYPEQHGQEAKAVLLELFEAMPKGDPLLSLYRRKLFNLLH